MHLNDLIASVLPMCCKYTVKVSNHWAYWFVELIMVSGLKYTLLQLCEKGRVSQSSLCLSDLLARLLTVYSVSQSYSVDLLRLIN